jgi:hypothetical protein
VQATQTTLDEYVREFEREYRQMVKHPAFEFYGGKASADNKACYVCRRLFEIRKQLTPYLHRPECLALAEMIDERL